MQFSENWLRSLVNPPLDGAALAHLLTMAGLEVEESRPVAPAFGNVVVAEVLAVDKHPDADKLKLCKVAVGQGEPLQIVCGAPNVAAGMKVPCALVGANLPGITIKKAKVRGIESFGMLCSARELGMTEEDQGGLLALAADAPVGQDIRAHLQLDDRLLTLKLTPNRADCLSLAGIAREVAALTGAPLTLPEIQPVAPTHDQQRQIVLDAPQACPRYCGRIIKGVDARAATPAWMVRALERSGIRSISASVDVTNYVMLELGQPLHAFDNARLNGAIHVRLPRPGEQLKLLNEQTVTPAADSPLIADEANGGRALALAGIMGGADSGVTDATTEIFLESAFFTPAAIAGKARELGFSSDSSYRFERGVDFDLPRRAIERATRLILDLCGGEPGPLVEALAGEHLPQRAAVRLRGARARKVLGIPLDDAQIEALLQRLGFPLRRAADDAGSFIVTPPSYRYDIEIEADLIEEIARLHGYDNIPAPAPRGRIEMRPLPETRRLPMHIRHQIAERDYFEVVNYSFIDATWEADFCANTNPIALANPIASQMNVMRSSLIAGLVNTLAYNLKRRIQRVRIFEIGRCFLPADDGQQVAGYRQPLRLAGLCTGPAAPLQWGEKARAVDFYDVKADVETLFGNRSHALSFAKSAHPALHPGRAADILLDGQVVGMLGEIHPAWVQKYELGSAPVVFEIDLDALGSQPLPQYRPVSRYPSVERDLALLMAQDQPVQPLIDALRAAAPAIVQRIELFDLYQGKGIAPEQKSLAFHIVMQDTEGTLADAEVDAAIQNLIDIATRQFAATLRS
ncbi:phenylalanine tRNA synthetase, beta subunit [Sterolibacterium denitrificans]|uniref:Phenylalanine--tRNA ligase beta subunit n=1 Tax=Sterolibacterium denitrificans TaxID=157592 RepID=A0A7Z7MUT8_9PROT|nr:phenylalanine--tRNA ligase subunit beta [Sterolibacterium denitrificans]SMB24278.1 phenylalanine tRNA synthetase, beta subunit [Sterolibacterium denitrificans]